MLKELENYVVALEDLNVGDRFESTGRTVTESDITTFAGLSADYNGLHIDAEYAAKTPFGQRIAHGMLVLSITSGLASRMPLMRFMEPSILGLLNLECRWAKPTFIGDTIHVEVEVADKRTTSKPDRGVVVLKRLAVNQRGETVMESEWKLLVRARGAS
jgi:acyl dehydratase